MCKNKLLVCTYSTLRFTLRFVNLFAEISRVCAIAVFTVIWMELVCQREITGSSTESWFASFDNGIKARRELWRVRNELKCHHNRKVEFHWEKFFVVRNAQKYASFWQFLFRAIFSQIWILFELFQVSFNIPLDCL